MQELKAFNIGRIEESDSEPEKSVDL